MQIDTQVTISSKYLKSWVPQGAYRFKLRLRLRPTGRFPSSALKINNGSSPKRVGEFSVFVQSPNDLIFSCRTICQVQAGGRRHRASIERARCPRNMDKPIMRIPASLLRITRVASTPLSFGILASIRITSGSSLAAKSTAS
jgi:hypothetical protein